MSEADRSIVVLTPGGGHARRLLPVIRGLAERGARVHVMTRESGRERVEAAGGTFIDLFGQYSVDAVDSLSIPFPCRLVSFAAAYLEPLAAEIARLRPRLIVYDSFMVVAPLVARRLGVPYVSVRAGHAQVPSHAMEAMRSDPRVRVSAACDTGVETLRTKYGVENANPFIYLDGVSPYLNLYPEPAAFLDDGARRAFQPIAFFGSLAPQMHAPPTPERPFASGAHGMRVYISFGSVIWPYYSNEALDALAVLADVLTDSDADILISLGNHAVHDGARRRLERPRVRVKTWVDQWSTLADADVFVTHHGLNSTHEAVFHKVPMLSYPFLGDQAAMADTCRRLGLALPLADRERAPLEARTVRDRLQALISDRRDFEARLEAARTWELEVIAARDAVFERMLAIAE